MTATTNSDDVASIDAKKKADKAKGRAKVLAVVKARNATRGPAQVDSYRSVIEVMHPDYFALGQMEPHLDGQAVRMNELRGLILGQSSETETELLKALRRLGIEVPQPQTAGQIRAKLDEYFEWKRGAEMPAERENIKVAVDVRNTVAHEHIEIGSVRRDYATGGGEWVPVISFMGGEPFDESDMLDNLDIQKEATRAAIQICAKLEDWDGQVRVFRLEDQRDAEFISINMDD